MSMREQQIDFAVKWLQAAKDPDPFLQVGYLAEKGLTQDEIAEACKRTAVGDGSSTIEPPAVEETMREADEGRDELGFKIGDHVKWGAVDEDIPFGTVGTVVGYTEEKVEVQFPTGAWNFSPRELLKVGATLVGNPLGPAHKWHSRRCAELLRRPGVIALLRECGVGTRKELLISGTLLVTIICLHLMLGRALNSFATTASAWSTVLLVLFASATFGAQCAYLVQALNHELGHGAPQVDLPRKGRKVVFLAVFSLGQFASALCHVPWTVYYMGGGHLRHHRFVGSARDVDEDALFVLYQPQFAGFVRRVCWMSVAAVGVPVWMLFSLCFCAFYNWRSNIKELSLVLLDFSLTAIIYYRIGGVGAAYLLLSSLFSMGFLCHPLAGFWILQHLCVGQVQPTTSYNGSRLWNILCLNELLHVEHHDVAGLAWRHLPRLRELAPDLYEPLHAETSMWALVGAWANALGPNGDARFEWDFACRTQWGYTRGAAKVAAEAQNMKAVKLMPTPARSHATVRRRAPGRGNEESQPPDDVVTPLEGSISPATPKGTLLFSSETDSMD